MKDAILNTVNTLLPKQLMNLIQHYEKQIKQLEDKLHLLEDENIRLVDQLEIYSHSYEEEINVVEQWLENCQYATKNNNKEQLQLLERNMPVRFIVNMEKEQRIQTLYLLLDLLASSNNKIDKYILLLLKNLCGHNISNDVRKVLKTEYDFFLNNIERTPEIHSLVLSILMDYNLQAILDVYLLQLIEDTTPQFFDRLSKEQLVQLFWLSFSSNFEDKFMQRCNNSQKSLMNSHKLSPAYVYGKNGKLQNSIYNEFKHTLKSTSLLSDEKKQPVFSKLNKFIMAAEDELKERSRNNLPHFSETNLHIVKDIHLEKFKQKYKLQEQEINIKIYNPSRSMKKSKMHSIIKAFVDPNKNTAFIGEAEFNNQKKRNAPNILMGSMKHYFEWPSTDVHNTPKKSDKKEINLKEKSDLRTLGYQVSTLTKEQRWPILQKAVQKLGLYKVAHTIANLIRLKKAVKNGENIYSKAISEWEYDLKRLKKVYYKNTFNWPK